jgi:UDP-2,3-diacylglucosamine pyrophosphatase LpxH
LFMNVRISDSQFIEVWNVHQGAQAVAKELGINVRNAHARRRAIEARTGLQLKAVPPHLQDITTLTPVQAAPNHVRHGIDVQSGTVLVFSDAHYWPDETTVAHLALLQLIKELKPKAVICNGDAFDGAAISRFPRIGWDHRPSVLHELQAVQEALGQIEKASPRGCQLIWTMGNHDARFETKLAQSAGEFEGIQGFHLKDHFKKWVPCWSVWINELAASPTIVKHRYKGGRTAGYANQMASGSVSIVTGHTHVLAVQPVSNYSGTFYGVQTGTLADPNGPQFADYTEDNPKDWRSGFAVLTFHKGRLLQPELVQVCGEAEYEFRGKVCRV